MQGTLHRTIGVIFRGRERQFTGTSSRVSRRASSLVLLILTTLGLTLLAGLFLSPHTPSASAAQSVPYKLNFQGRLTTSSGTVVADGLYNMQFKLYDTSTAGTLLWSETRETTNRVQVTNGLFSVQLGDVTALSPSLFNNATARYFEITQATPATANCSTAACATWESPMSPRQPMGSAAYAMNADLLDGQDGSYYQDATNLTAGTVSSARLTGSYTGVTGTGALAAGSIANGFGTIVTANTIQGTTITGTTGFNSTGANGYQVGGTTVLTSGRLLQNVLGYTQSSGSATFNQNAADLFKIVALQAPTSDMAQITNSGFPTVTAGVNGLQIDYFGGAAAVESGAVRLNVNPGSTSGGTWNGLRVTSNATGPVAGVTLNGAKFEGPTTQGAGTENALYFDTKWDNILNVAGTSVLTAGRVLQNVTTDASILTSGTITSARLTGSYTGITGLGTVTTGTWQGSTVAGQYGGTGINGSTAANGSLLIGNGTGYSLATLTAGTGISVTNSAGGITIGTTGGGSYVDLQATTPGTAQTGNINVTGTVVAGNKIGIGVSPSAALLHVQSNTDASTTMLALETGIHGGTRLDVVGTSNNESGLSLKVYRAGVYTERIAVGINGALGLQATSADGVGIGTASPSAKLHVVGDALFRSTSTTAFQVQDGAGASLLAVDSTNLRLQVGNVTADSTGVLLVLDSKNTSGDPTGVSGGMYYNSLLEKFRCYQGGRWVDCAPLNPSWPDGTTGTPINVTAISTNTANYTVPAGKTLYITSAYCSASPATTSGVWTINNVVGGSCHGSAGGVTSVSPATLGSPVPFAAGTTVQLSAGVTSNKGFSGLLVDSGVTIVNVTAISNNTANYTVPAGETLYITSAYCSASTATTSGTWAINNVVGGSCHGSAGSDTAVSPATLGSPVPFAAGTTVQLSAGLSSNKGFTGYLVSQ